MFVNALSVIPDRSSCAFFFFNDTATTEIYTLSLHDALPISGRGRPPAHHAQPRAPLLDGDPRPGLLAGRHLHRTHGRDRKSTRLNSSHANISYAVFCLKKKTPKTQISSLT